MPSSPLSYPSLGDLPILLVNIINSKTGGAQMFQMLVDTGSARTCLPADRAEFFGHDNEDHRVKTTTIRGVGGTAKAHIHTLRIELIDPLGRTWRKLIPPWRSAMTPVLLAETIDTKTGILGRDILGQMGERNLPTDTAHASFELAYRDCALDRPLKSLRVSE